MANEIQWRGTETGETLYATIRSASGTQWNTAGTPNFEAVTAANWADYDIALAESSGNYFYVGTFPAISGNMVAGWYWVDIYKQAGGTPAITDVLQGTIVGYWNGTSLLPWAADAQEWKSGVIATPSVTGVPEVDLTHVGGVAASGVATVDANVVSISGDTDAANNAESFFDGTGYAGTNNVIPLVTVTTTATNLTNLPAAAATAAELAKVPKSDSTVTWNATALASINAEVDTALNTAIPGSPTANSINERVATMDGLLLGTIQAGTHVAQSGDSYARLGAPAGASIAADLVTLDNFLDTEVAAILQDTDELQKAWTDGGRLDLLIDAIKGKTDLMLDAAAIRTAVGLESANLDTQIATLATAANLATLDTLVDKMAPLLIGTVTGAGTATEVYVYDGVTATVTADADGNVSAVVFS